MDKIAVYLNIKIPAGIYSLSVLKNCEWIKWCNLRLVTFIYRNWAREIEREEGGEAQHLIYRAWHTM